MRIHVLDSTRFEDTDDLLTEILSRSENGSIDALVLIDPELEIEAFIKKLEDLGIMIHPVVGNQMPTFCDRPSIIDLMLGSQGVSSYEIWTHDSEPQKLFIDPKLLDLLGRLKEATEGGRVDIQKYLLSDLSSFFQRSHKSMSVSVKFFENQYSILNRLLEDIFCKGGIASSNELLILGLNSNSLTSLDEFRLIVNGCNKIMPVLHAGSPTIALKLKNIRDVYSMAHATLDNENGWQDPNKAASCFVWVAAFLAIYAQTRLAEYQSFSVFLAAFRIFELISYALLLKASVIEFRNGKELVFTGDDSKLMGFGKAWGLCKQKLKRQKICTMKRLEQLDEFIELRNNLLLIHGLGYVNKELAAKYLSEVHGYAADIEKKMDRQLQFDSKVKRFQSVHCHDVASMAIESVKESLSIQGSFDIAN